MPSAEAAGSMLEAGRAEACISNVALRSSAYATTKPTQYQSHV